MLFVSGGFYDGRHTIVEPLGPPRFMLEDSTGFRQDQLTRLLYALRKGVDDIQKCGFRSRVVDGTNNGI